jgi:hypothetical protein
MAYFKAIFLNISDGRLRTVTTSYEGNVQVLIETHNPHISDCYFYITD